MLRYYYFRVFTYFSEGSSIPLFRTFIVMFVFMYFNFLGILNIISLWTDKKLLLRNGKEMVWFWPLLIVLPLFILFYYYLKKPGYHSGIIEQFRNEPSRKRFLNGFFIVGYYILSIALFIFTLWLRQEIKHY